MFKNLLALAMVAILSSCSMVGGKCNLNQGKPCCCEKCEKEKKCKCCNSKDGKKCPMKDKKEAAKPATKKAEVKAEEVKTEATKK